MYLIHFLEFLLKFFVFIHVSRPTKATRINICLTNGFEWSTSAKLISSVTEGNIEGAKGKIDGVSGKKDLSNFC